MRTRFTVATGIAVITTVLAATVSGCGSGSGSSGKTIKVVYQKQLNSSNTVQPDFLAAQVKEFEKANPGTTVKLVPVTASENDYYTKIQLMMRSPVTAPDLVYEDTATINSDVASGYLKPLDSYLSTWKDWSRYATASKAAMKYAKDGKTYGVPDNTDTRGIWYNKTLLKQAGIALPWQPKTWADVLAAANAIKAKVPGVTPLNVYTGTAGGEQSSMQGFEMLLYGTAAGGDSLYNAAQQKWVVGSPGFKDALNFLHTVYSQGLGPKVQTALGVNIGAQVGTEMIPQGKLAIDLDGSWMPNNWIRTGPKPWPQWETTMGEAAMPTQNGQDKGKVSMSGGWAWSIPAKAKNTDLAWKFLQSLETETASAQWNNVNATIPTRQDVAADPTYLKALPTNQFFSGLVADTYYRPGVPAYTQVSSAIQKAMESVTTGQASVDKAASTFDNDVKSAVGADNTMQGTQ
ncbi:carbohydrate ABC transporter substrate-binding protein, CUT1 family [Actinacidiphila yanglinensis]|uniref:Carbohydrate ABC transporter substrate-binding protein, CUT1 family n=1 Tax=Actinacidiphila yanglinensis TaxID=310779 RepID=A0A1H6B6U4_9ACTN|nr:extracellular solute-binding protein [Actinacidiphila yanglinensis]SEG55856.1 carbohydrate ABC transporter substrate-binding protein, CUT1 family [Actinacidiphila yanglinensis]